MSFARLATSIDHNAKGKALLKALAIAFAKSRGTRRGGPEGHHLHRIAPHPKLPAAPAGGQPFAEGIVLFNGSNTDDRSK